MSYVWNSIALIVLVGMSHTLCAAPILYTFSSRGVLELDGQRLPEDDLVLSFAGDTDDVAGLAIDNLSGTLRFGDVVTTFDSLATIRLSPGTETYTSVVAFPNVLGRATHTVQNEIFLSTLDDGELFNVSTVLDGVTRNSVSISSQVAGFDLKSDFMLSGPSGRSRPTDFAGQQQFLDWDFVLSTSTEAGKVVFFSGDFDTGPTRPLGFTFASSTVPEPSSIFVWVLIFPLMSIRARRP